MNSVADPVTELLDTESLAASMEAQTDIVANRMRHVTDMNARLREARENLEDTKLNVLSEGYASGRINGKNAEERNAQIAAMLSKSAAYQGAVERQRKAEQAFEIAKTEEEIENKRLGTYHSIAHIKGAQLMYAAARGGAY